MLLFAIVPAAVSIYTQRTVAELYSRRTVAEISTLIFEIRLRDTSVTQLTIMILCKAEPAKTDFWLKLRPVEADHYSETAGRRFGDGYEGRGCPHVEKHKPWIRYDRGCRRRFCSGEGLKTRTNQFGALYFGTRKVPK